MSEQEEEAEPLRRNYVRRFQDRAMHEGFIARLPGKDTQVEKITGDSFTPQTLTFLIGSIEHSGIASSTCEHFLTMTSRAAFASNLASLVALPTPIIDR